MFPISSYSTHCVCDITSVFQGCVQGSHIGGGHASVTRPRNSKTGADHAPSRPLSYLKLQNAFTEFLYHRPFGAAQYNARVANSLSSNISLSPIKEFKNLHFHEPDSNGFAVVIPKLPYTYHWWYWYW